MVDLPLTKISRAWFHEAREEQANGSHPSHKRGRKQTPGAKWRAVYLQTPGVKWRAVLSVAKKTSDYNNQHYCCHSCTIEYSSSTSEAFWFHVKLLTWKTPDNVLTSTTVLSYLFTKTNKIAERNSPDAPAMMASVIGITIVPMTRPNLPPRPSFHCYLPYRWRCLTDGRFLLWPRVKGVSGRTRRRRIASWSWTTISALELMDRSP